VDELTAALVTSRDAQGEFDLSLWGDTGMMNLTPLWLLKYLPNMLACHVTIIHDCQGPSNTITCAEASAALSVGESMRVIQRGAADACLSGGAEAKLNPMGLLRQVFSGRLAKVNGTGDPAGVVKPFDPAATGTLLGDGGGIVVLEAMDTARARGARVYAEVAGFAATQSFCPDTVGLEVDAEGQAMGDAIESALEAARVSANDIDAIAPFGSGIPKIDQAESASLRRLFGSRTASIPIITAIPNVGNCCAGASAIPLAVAAKAVAEQRLPARINTTGAKGLDANAAPTRAATLRHVLVTTCGMGGQCAAIVLRKFDGGSTN
jgi:3-oxoacyl-[acyl-carrier-protein] synthase II